MVSCPHCGNRLGDGETPHSDWLTVLDTRLSDDIDHYWETSNVSDPDNGAYRSQSTFREKVKLLFPRVARVARNGDTATYADVWGDNVDPYALKYYLGAISTVEHRYDRPLLSSVIVNSELGYSSDGYYLLIERLDGLPDDINSGDETEKREWWREQLEAVHEFWGNR